MLSLCGGCGSWWDPARPSYSCLLTAIIWHVLTVISYRCSAATDNGNLKPRSCANMQQAVGQDLNADRTECCPLKMAACGRTVTRVVLRSSCFSRYVIKCLTTSQYWQFCMVGIRLSWANHRLAVWHIMAVNPVGRHFSRTLGRHCTRRSGRSAFRHGANRQSVRF